MAKFTAIFDACVLDPAPLRDLLMSLAMTGLFRAKWTAAIPEEWNGNLLRNWDDLTRPQLERTRDLMNRAVSDALVAGSEDLIASLTLPDPDDRHVLAAAIRGRADVIVTSNLKDFPETALKPYDIEAQHPDEFINHLLSLDEALVVAAVKANRARLKDPLKTPEAYLFPLQQQDLAQTVRGLTPYLELI